MTQPILRAADALPRGQEAPTPEQKRRPRTAKQTAKSTEATTRPKRSTDRREQAAEAARSRPVETFRDGTTETSVWLNDGPGPLDPPEWKISQRRFIPTAGGGIYAHSLRLEDLDPARWGLYRARQWTKKALPLNLWVVLAESDRP